MVNFKKSMMITWSFWPHLVLPVLKENALFAYAWNQTLYVTGFRKSTTLSHLTP